MHRNKLPPLNALRVFVVVGKTTSLRQAASLLCVSHTAVSRQVRELEAWFGVKLVRSGSEGTELTVQGRHLLEDLNRGFEFIQRGVRAVLGNQPRSLRVHAPPGFATYWLLPRMSALQASIPDVHITLMPTERTPSFRSGEADVAILYGEVLSAPFVSEFLFRPRQVALATHDWCLNHKNVCRPIDLLNIDLVHEYPNEWAAWFEALACNPPRDLKGLQLGVMPAALEAVCAGAGPGLFPIELNIESTRSELRRVLPHQVRIAAYHLTYDKSNPNFDLIFAFREWIKEAVRIQAHEIIFDDALEKDRKHAFNQNV